VTCIVGIVDDGSVYMGADSAQIAGWRSRVNGPSKMFRHGDLLMGVAGSNRASQLLQYNLVIPEHPAGMDTRQWLITAFVPAVRVCLKEGGFAKKENEVESTTDGVALIGYRGALWTLHTDYQIASYRDAFTVIGCGDEHALGALAALVGDPLPPTEKLRRALQVAADLNMGVRPPFDYVTCLARSASNGHAPKTTKRAKAGAL
jgi:ATP-dependent protease HslVU (ClpYQ) peptidase subunit